MLIGKITIVSDRGMVYDIGHGILYCGKALLNFTRMCKMLKGLGEKITSVHKFKIIIFVISS